MERSATAAPAHEAAGQRVLEAHGIHKRFGERRALAGVSMAAARGERVAVIGPNGAGKTTLLSILAGIQRPDEGNLELGADRDGASRRIGWVPQHPALYGKLTVAENLRLFARLERCSDQEAVVERMLGQTALRERAGDQVAELSGGNRQRLNIAIGLLGAPAVLLLDEPSASLDPRQRDRLWQFVTGLSRGGTTIIFSTHNVQEAERFADQVIVLADGELLFAGSPRALEAEVGAAGLGFEAAFVSFLHQRGH